MIALPSVGVDVGVLRERPQRLGHGRPGAKLRGEVGIRRGDAPLIGGANICFVAAWIANFNDEISNDRNFSFGSFNMRTNMVGTSCVWVALYRPTSRRNSSASKFSIRTQVPPSFITVMLKRSGAA